jgi:hypothetical protein
MDRLEMLHALVESTGITYGNPWPEPLEFFLWFRNAELPLQPSQVVEYLGSLITEHQKTAERLATIRDALEEEIATDKEIKHGGNKGISGEVAGGSTKSTPRV